MLREHMEHGAALTIGAVRIPVSEAHAVRHACQIAADGRVIGFVEKPKENAPGDPRRPGLLPRVDGHLHVRNGRAREAPARTDHEMPEGEGGDFGHHVIPRMIEEVPVYAHFFRGPGEDDASRDDKPYWRDVGTIEAYFDANMDLCNVKPQLNLYREDWPTYTLWHNDPPAKTVFSEAGDGRRSEVHGLAALTGRRGLRRQGASARC